MPRPSTGAKLGINAQGYYEIRYSEAGRSRHVSTGTRDLVEAGQALAGFLTESKKEISLLVGDVLDAYETSHVDNRVVDKKRAKPIIARLKIAFAGLSIGDVDQGAADGYLADRVAGKYGRKVTPTTVKRELIVLIAAANAMAKAKRMSWDDVPSLTLPANAPPRDRWLTDQEFDRLLAAMPLGRKIKDGHRYSRLFLWTIIARETAARRRSIERLTWFLVDLDRKVINYQLLPGAKTKKRRVQVAISDALYQILVRAKETKINEFVLDNAATVKRAFKRIAKAAGFADVSPHTLRHTWATRASQEGVSMADIASVMGDTVETVTRNYLHFSPAHQRAAVNFRKGKTGA